MKSCRGIWQVLTTRQNSKMFLRLAEWQLSSLSIITCSTQMYTYVTSELKNKTLNKFLKSKIMTVLIIHSVLKEKQLDGSYFLHTDPLSIPKQFTASTKYAVQKSLLCTVRTRPLKITHLLFSSFTDFFSSHSPPNNS